MRDLILGSDGLIGDIIFESSTNDGEGGSWYGGTVMTDFDDI